MLGLVVASTIVLLALRCHILVALVAPAILYAVLNGLPAGLLFQRAFAGIDQFGLVAIPLFVLSGMMLQRSGAIDDIVSALATLLRNVKGGHALINVFDSALFSGINGSAAADVA